MLKYIVLVVLIGLFLGFRYLIVPHAVEQSKSSFHFDMNALPDSPNYFLAMPESIDEKTEARMMQSPVFSVDTKTLERHVSDVLKQQPRMQFLKKMGQDAFLFVQYSAFWHFPDMIYGKVVAQDGGKSSLILYSFSLFGHYDFKVNEQRVTTILGQVLQAFE